MSFCEASQTVREVLPEIVKVPLRFVLDGEHVPLNPVDLTLHSLSELCHLISYPGLEFCELIVLPLQDQVDLVGNQFDSLNEFEMC